MGNILDECLCDVCDLDACMCRCFCRLFTICPRGERCIYQNELKRRHELDELNSESGCDPEPNDPAK